MLNFHKNYSTKVALTIASIFYGLLFLIPISTKGQSITKAEYFFDTDPGQGNGTVISFTPTGGNVTFTTSLSTASLSEGFHQLGIRAKESGGVWSIFESRGFYISTATANTTNLVAAEYFLDSDPGNGNGTPIAVSAGANVNFVVSVPTTSLSPGFHFLAIRTKGLGGKWGLFEARGFYITSSTTNVANIVNAEYFFDADPGNGNGTPISVTAGATTNFTVSLPATGLQPGFHFLAIRTKDSNGKWGIFESRGFYITASTIDAATVSNAEYFFDTDPGQGNGIAISITPGTISNFTATIPATGLTPGFHFLAIRTKGSDGRWGIFESRGFYVSPIVASAGDIVKAEYFIDTDPGENNGIALTVNPSGPTINQIFPIAIAGVTSGAHALGIRVKDANGIWSAVQMENFTVLNCTPPAAPTAPPVSRCSSGTVTINATGAAAGQTYHWYADATTTTVTSTGPSFTTPTVTTTTSYFVSVFDPVTLCESLRTQVSATVNTTSKPTLNATGNISLCEGSSFLLSAPAGFSSYSWTNGATTQQILVTSNGRYSVVVGDGTCSSLASDTVTFTFATRPIKPVVIASGPTTLCDGGTVILTAPAGFDSYEWSSGETTSSITKDISGNYSVIVTNATGCKSAASSETIVTASTSPIQPSVEVTGLTTLCIGAFALLTAPSGFTHYEWSGGEISQTLVVKKEGTYSVKVSNDPACYSPSSNAIQITESGQACSTNPANPSNRPPEIKPASITSAIEGKVTINLLPLLSDDDGVDDVVVTSLRIVGEPASGAIASIDSDFNLVLDYNKIPFSGIEYLTIQVCDRSGSCTQQELKIEVAGDVIAYTAVSPNGDDKNEVLYLEYIDIIPDTKDNLVTIYNRWGNVVFDIANYDNDRNVFNGFDKNGNELPNDNYFYKIVFGSGKKSKTGFITLRR